MQVDAAQREDDAIFLSLGALRRRYRWRLLVLYLLWAVAAALVASAALRLMPGWERLVPFDEPAISMSVAGLVLAVGLLLVWLLSPDEKAIARRLDARLDLDDRLSTALDISAHQGKETGPVARMLVSDVNERVRGFVPALLVPMFTASMLWAAGIAVVAAGINWALPGGQEVRLEAPPAIGGGGLGVTIEDVIEIARLVQIDADTRDEDLLGATAANLRSLAQEAAQGLSQDQIDQRLAAFMDDARLGYGGTPPRWLPGANEDLNTVGERIAAHRDELAQQAAESGSFAQGSVAVPEGAQPDVPFADLGAIGMPSAEREGGEGGEAVPGGLPQAGLGDNPQSPGDEPVSAQGTVPVGASMQAGRGEGDMAGLGSQPLLGTEDVGIGEGPGGEDLTLTSAEPIAGNRIRVQMPPSADEAEADVPRTSHALSGNTRLSAELVSREWVGSAEQPVVSRYFAPSDASTGPGER